MSGIKSGKRPDLLLDLMHNILHKTDKKIKLLVAGINNKGEYEVEFFNKIKQYKLKEYVSYVGFVEPELFLNIVDIYICPSYLEGMPQSLMQAMMMGKACISSDVGSIRELNIDNNLLLVDKVDVNMFERYLNMLIQDKSFRDEIGEKNYSLSRQYFSKNNMKQKLNELYRGLV
jgi:glycosyltransferase involved in cell wall biosynthesis